MKKTVFDRYPALKKIPPQRFPNHVFIIPDGNGRWAKQRKVFITIGHKKGFEVAEKVIRDLSEIPYIKIVTLWGFSSDNWKRDAIEIKGLMTIFGLVIKKVLKEFNRDNRRFIHIGRKDRLPKQLLSLINKAEVETSKNTGQILCLGLDFSGEDQELRMIERARELPREIKTDQDLIWNLRDSSGIVKGADLLIRTSGEMRTSDVGWLNGISTELFFIKKYFPDLTTQDIVDGLVDFSKRERRFGGR